MAKVLWKDLDEGQCGFLDRRGLGLDLIKADICSSSNGGGNRTQGWRCQRMKELYLFKFGDATYLSSRSKPPVMHKKRTQLSFTLTLNHKSCVENPLIFRSVWYFSAPAVWQRGDGLTCYIGQLINIFHLWEQ